MSKLLMFTALAVFTVSVSRTHGQYQEVPSYFPPKEPLTSLEVSVLGQMTKDRMPYADEQSHTPVKLEPRMPYAEEDEEIDWGSEFGMFAKWTEHRGQTFITRPVSVRDFANTPPLTTSGTYMCDGRDVFQDKRLLEDLAYFGLPLLIGPGESRLQSELNPRTLVEALPTVSQWLVDCETHRKHLRYVTEKEFQWFVSHFP